MKQKRHRIIDPRCPKCHSRKFHLHLSADIAENYCPNCGWHGDFEGIGDSIAVCARARDEELAQVRRRRYQHSPIPPLKPIPPAN